MADEDVSSGKFLDKLWENPQVPVGILGVAGIVAYGLVKFRNRGDTKASVYLIHLRVAAQGTLLTCLTLGLAYNMWNTHISKLPYFSKEK